MSELVAKKETELATIQSQSSLSPMVQAVLSGQMTPEQLQALLNVQKEYERNEAEKAFHRALAEFKKHDIQIGRDKLVTYKTDKGTTSYRHATLGAALTIVNPILSQYGLSLTWTTNQDMQNGGRVKVTCVLSHAMGFSTSTSLEASPDSSGSKNNIQAIGSTISYLERYTAFSLLGLASMDQDDDGAGADGPEYINEEQVVELERLLSEVKADKAMFLKYMKVAGLTIIPVDQYDRAVRALNAKKSKKVTK